MPGVLWLWHKRSCSPFTAPWSPESRERLSRGTGKREHPPCGSEVLELQRGLEKGGPGQPQSWSSSALLCV